MLQCFAEWQRVCACVCMRVCAVLVSLRMDLTKSHRSSLLAIPSRWPPILIGLTAGLFISALFTSNFAMTKIVPARTSISSLSSSYHPFSSTSTTSINQLFIQLLFKSTHTHSDGHQELLAPAPARPYKRTYIPYLDESVESSHDTDADILTELKSVKQQALQLQDMVETNVKSTANEQKQADDIVGALKRGYYATDTVISNDSTSLTSESGSQHASKDIVGISGLNTDEMSKLAHRDTIDNMEQAHRTFSSSSNSKCDISIGKWVEDNTYPLYDLGSCPFIDEGFSCHQNGRPDRRYSQWRWAPRDCEVPRFNGTAVLERLRGKRMVFVGDSLNRNQWESMLCMLRESLADKSRIVQVQGSRISKLPGGYAFTFLDYDCRIEFYASPYLVDREEGSNQTRYVIKLDKMDKLERRWRKASVLVFNTGHWWTPDKIGDGENCFQERNTVHAKLDVMVAYTKALSTWAKWVDRYINPHNTTVFFRGYSPVHYTGGQWNSGGQCQNETEPIYKESYLTAYPDKMQALESVVQGMRVPVHVLNITRLSDYRKDGHPATFGHPPDQVVSHQDCSHWCLPGLPDIWNELLSFALMKQYIQTDIP